MTDALHRDFERDGFTVVRSLVTETRVAYLLATSQALSDDRRAGEDAPAAMCYVRSPSRVLQHWDPHNWRGLAVAEALLGERVRHHEDLLLAKPAGCPSDTPWHQDAAYYVGEGLGFERAVACWLALSHVSQRSGGLQFIPGSHRRGLLPHVPVDHPTIPDALEARGVDPKLAVSPDLAPGDATFHHCRTLHYSGANSSREARVGLIAHMWPAEHG